MKFPQIKLPRIPYGIFLIGPWVCAGLGLLMNMLVQAANGARMPFLSPGGTCLLDPEDIWHVCMTAQTHLKFLADWMNYRQSMMSPGDVLLHLGEETVVPGIIAWFTLVFKDYQTK